MTLPPFRRGPGRSPGRVHLLTAVAAALVLATGASLGLAASGASASDSAGASASATASASASAAAAPPGLTRAEALAARRTPVVDVFERCRDAVVNIASTEIDEVVVRRSPFDLFFDDMFDAPGRPRARTRTRTRRSVGSGFVLHPDGYIVTNAHVVSPTADELKAIFADGREFDARIVATDRQADLAVLKIDADESFPTLPLGRSDDLLIGETVVAIGNPLGFQHTVTAGVVSATERSIEISEGRRFEDLIQTDASINPGNSGGPLLNVLGELIGVNTAIRGDAQNIGFAISVDRLRETLPELLDVERRYRITTGFRLDPLASGARTRVAEVDAGSPAARAGLAAGDRLVAVGGQPVANPIDFDIAIMGRTPGDAIDLEIERDGRSRAVELTLDARPVPDGTRLAWERLGVRIEPLPEDAAQRLGLRRAGGLFVADVDAEGPGGTAGLEPLDVLLAVGGVATQGLEDLGRRLERAETGDRLPMRILRIERRGKVVLQGEVAVR